jgi:molybdenum cofactor cytidylyltransferase
MASSVEIGFAQAQLAFAGAQAALLWPVDHARVAERTLRTLIATAAAAPDPCAIIVVPRYRGRGGHPALVGRSYWPALASCAVAPQGARSVFREHAAAVRSVESDDPGVIADVDRPGDLQ